MKLGIFVLSLFLCFSFSKIKYKRFIPPGTVQINDTLFADQTEVSNLSWSEFVYWTKTKYGNGSREHLFTLPDSSVWYTNEKNKTSIHAIKTFNTLAYRDYPIVGVTYEQVLAFCKWRTERVKEYMWISKKYKLLNFEYRLPTKQEWEMLSNNGNNVFPYKNDFKFKSNKQKDQIYKLYYRANCIFNDTIPKFNSTMPVYSYFKNYFNLFNMIGNVSEMVLEKNISKGGSWQHHIENCRVGKDIFYSGASNWLGFRCVCVIKN